MRSSMSLALAGLLWVLVTGAAGAEEAETNPVGAPESAAAGVDGGDAAGAGEGAEVLPGGAPEAQAGAVVGPAAPADAGAVDAELAGAGVEASVPEVAPNGVALGPVGYDSEGREGRIHVVVKGDTLWDISTAYLGTPWVWPSVWQDNRGIENPHLIYPGDRIWITDGEMRVVSREEADALLAGRPAALDEGGEELVTGIAEPQLAPVLAAEPRTQRVASRESVGFISAGDYEASASVVDATDEKSLLSQGDSVYIGLGAGDVAPGDQYTVFRKQERVFDPDTGRLLGYHVDVLGWVEVKEARAEASLALIRESHAEIERGDRVVRREELPAEIAVLQAPEGVEGKVSFFARSRTLMGMDDFVYLNRGTLDGVEVGSPLEVYRPAYPASEPARGTRVEVPDRVVAQLLVVKAEPNTSVAFVIHTAGEIELGDHVRAATGDAP